MAPDWRWLLDRNDSPWYPGLRLFRQHRLGDWSDVFARISSELAVVFMTKQYPTLTQRNVHGATSLSRVKTARWIKFDAWNKLFLSNFYLAAAYM